MPFVLRKYQSEAVKAGIDFFNDKNAKENSIIVIPTGGGKSIIIAEIAKELQGNTIVFQPSKELLEQNFKKFISYGYRATIYSASGGQKVISKVTFATIGSVFTKSEMFKGFDNIIIDECHLVSPESSSMYQKFFKVLNKKILGLTATPIRLKAYNFPVPHSKLCMLDRMRPRVFSKYIYITQISEIIAQGFWTKLEYFEIKYDASKLKENSTGADYTEQSLIESNDYNSINSKIHNYTNRLIAHGKKHILIFVTSIADAEFIAMNNKNIKYIHSKIDKMEREKTINWFKSGRIPAIVNVGILTTGFDFPELDCIILGRKTMSLGLLYQMIGRGVRIAENKTNCYILDLVGNVETFGKVENLIIKQIRGLWCVTNGQKILTNVSMSDDVLEQKQVDESNIIFNFGKYKDKNHKISEIPDFYLKWFFENIAQNQYNKHYFDWIKNNKQFTKNDK